MSVFQGPKGFGNTELLLVDIKRLVQKKKLFADHTNESQKIQYHRVVMVGCILFLLYVNDLPKRYKEHFLCG